MSGHTPGPWIGFDGKKHPSPNGAWDAHDDDACCYEWSAVVDASGDAIALVVASDDDYFPEDRVGANARLIAAAPELLEALQRLLANDCPITGNPTHAALVQFWNEEQQAGNGEAPDQLFALAAIAKAAGSQS